MLLFVIDFTLFGYKIKTVSLTTVVCYWMFVVYVEGDLCYFCFVGCGCLDQFWGWGWIFYKDYGFKNV